MLWTSLITPAFDISKLALSALFEETVEPEIGSIVYCDIVPGYAQHSGVYIGDGEIVHLTSSGLITTTSPNKFMNKGIKLATCIWVSCCGEEPVGSQIVAQRAKDKLYSFREYNLLLDNCHQFCAGCLSGDFENSSNILPMLAIDCEEYLGFDNWRIWFWRDWEEYIDSL